MQDTSEIINSAISEATPAKTEAPKVDDSEVEVKDENQPEQEDSENLDAENSQEDPTDDLPKNVKKKLESNKRYIRNLREREKSLIAEVQRLKSEKIEPKQIREEEFQGTYGELIKQQALEEMKAAMSQNHQQMQLRQLELQQAQIMQEQVRVASEEAAEFARQSSDFATVVTANKDRFDTIPDQIQSLFYELESPTLAAYALAKEGRIEQLSYMSPYMAAAEIKAAEARGRQYLNQTSKKPVSTAPAPVQGVRGASKSAGASAQLSQKGADDLYKWINT